MNPFDSDEPTTPDSIAPLEGGIGSGVFLAVVILVAFCTSLFLANWAMDQNFEPTLRWTILMGSFILFSWATVQGIAAIVKRLFCKKSS